MSAAKLPDNEKERLQKLKDYQILDTLPEQDFDDFTKLASFICNTPISLISLIDETRQWFKSHHGLDATETSREVAFCAHAILQDEVFVIPDSSKDIRFKDNPLFIEYPHVHFYAGAPLKTPSGHNIGTLCVIDNKPNDLTKDQIEALRCLARQVVNLMELRSSKIEAEKEAKLKSTFLATMSHEIRTPLNGIIGCTNLLIDTVKNKEQKSLLKIITRSSDALLTLINDILDFSKLEAGKVEIEAYPFDLKETVTDIIKLFESQAKAKSIDVILDFKEDNPSYVLGDTTKIRQVLNNLISNAIKFTEKGSIHVLVESKPLENKKYDVRFTVKDTGIGISEKQSDKLFKSFSQADVSTSRKFGGSGLGLAICKSLVQLMGGEINFTSKPNHGSTFSFNAILTKCSKARVTRKSKFKINPQMGIENPLSILLVEDNRINQLVTIKMLEKLYYKVDIASNGLEALEILKFKEYDAVFMDCEMPEMDGLEATRIIKADPTEYHSPFIIALTASSQQEDVDKCEEAGMNYFLSKPLRLEEIVDALTAVIEYYKSNSK